MSHLWKKVQDEIIDAKTFTKKALTLFWFPVKDIKIPDIFYKILNFLGPSWAVQIKRVTFLVPQKNSYNFA